MASPSRCASFKLPRSSVDATLTKTTFFPENATVDITNPFSSINTNTLPAFCRVEVAITTNSTANSTAHAELWLPESFNGRFLGFGNGGFGGGVNVADLGFVAVTQGFAGMSTDTGHLSGSGDGSWAGPHNDNAIIDWSWRALHLSVIVGKAVVKSYYGRPQSKSYYLGCSTGSDPLKEAGRFPEDFDGIVIGSPANRMATLQPWSIHASLEVMPVDSPRFIPANTWNNVVHPEVLKQCDSLDGLADGIINDPLKCNFRPETLTCRPGQNTSTCLNLDQIDAIHHLYAPYFDTNQTFVFTGFYPGGETGLGFGLLGAVPFSIPADFYKFFVLNDTSFTQDQFNFDIAQLGERLNVGTMDIAPSDLSSFLDPKRGGKILQYVGWADQLISVGNSLTFFESVHAFIQSTTNNNIDDFYRLFTVPGMQHWQSLIACHEFNSAGGSSANAFGGSGQASSAMPPSSLDAQHNILAAMVQWVEHGIAPDTVIATAWKGNNVSNGLDFQRPLCKYPTNLVFKGGDSNDLKNFACV
ncbi:feruloyl esterase-like protein [Panus rudis PR-1116 ss-1]|nr:feruloyl esterase-like protein [Panus rudis PR-1116 ss-1]